MRDKGVELSDAKIKALSKRLDGIYQDAYSQAIKNTEKATRKFEDLTDEKLKDLTPEAKRLKRQAFASEIKRNKALQTNILKEIEQAGATASKLVQGEITGIYNLNYEWATYDIQQQSGLDLIEDFAIYDRNQLASILATEQSPFTKIAYSALQDADTFSTMLQNQLAQSAILGEGQPKVIKRIKNVTGYGRSRAKTIAQTERNRVQSQGRFLGIQEATNIGISMEKQWIARLIRTREQHQETHLEIKPENKQFSNGLMFSGDPNGKPWNVINCFCVLEPIVVSVSPALKASREKYQKIAFEDYQKRMKTEIKKKKKGV